MTIGEETRRQIEAGRRVLEQMKSSGGWKQQARDPQQVIRVAELLLNIREKWPEGRMLQIVSAAIPAGTDPFHIRDEDLVRYLERFAEEQGR
ncbi:MAG: hypothetical protein KIT79_00965 [Deltaproteobacteria bacterium]|nr:hypothetical protein [Deltaproteobacteria bacterium]